jgi:hypothetical protein
MFALLLLRQSADAGTHEHRARTLDRESNLSGQRLELGKPDTSLCWRGPRVALLQVWDDPASHSSVQLLQESDYVLTASIGMFEDSTQRCGVWFKNLLAWILERARDDNHLDNTAFIFLRDLAQRHPDAVGRQLVPQLSNKNWPALYRRSISCGLLTAYDNAAQPDPSWEPSLTACFLDLMMTGDPYPIRVAAGDLACFAGDVQRPHLPDARLKAAIGDAVKRLTAESTQPGASGEYKVAAPSLRVRAPSPSLFKPRFRNGNGGFYLRRRDRVFVQTRMKRAHVGGRRGHLW